MTHDDDLHDDIGSPSPIIPFEDLMFACANLCEVIELENEALESHDAQTIGALTENKIALARLYEQAMAPMAAHPELAETLEPEQREELLAMGLRLKELMKVNAMRLEAEMEAYQRVMDIIAEGAKRKAANVTNYDRGGAFSNEAATGAAVAYNKSL